MTVSRDAAWQLLNEYTKSESLLKHAMAVETAVRGYARKFQIGFPLFVISGRLLQRRLRLLQCRLERTRFQSSAGLSHGCDMIDVYVEALVSCWHLSRRLGSHNYRGS